jgi:Flp pilus assembly protein TadG
MSEPRFLVDFARDRSAAIAPLYALALFGLIMIAGVGWDYSRMATMDSELQNAADQAALAAATQLTGITGARQRAQDAATTYFATAGSAWANETKLSNDGDGRTVGGLSFEFFQSWNHTTDVPGPAATSDANARYVRVTVAGREAFYALTAIGGLASSGDMGANAVATLESAACNIPPVMVCAPTGDAGWPRASDIGVAVDMREGPQSSTNFTAGNFDLLNIDYTNVAQSDQNRTLGLNSDLLGCSGGQLQTDPGRRTPQSTAVNTRFGIYPKGNDFSCQANGSFCPAQVTRNNLIRAVTVNGNGNNDTCANTAGGTLIPYTDIPGGGVPEQGFPLDTCQSLGLAGCLSFGDGAWPVDTYLNNIHGTNSASTPGLDADGNGRITRYEVYNWERANPSRTTSRELRRVTTRSPNRTTLYCSAPLPIAGTPVVPSTTQKDRRLLTMAVVDCAGNNGQFDVNTFKFVDMFLISPMIEQGGQKQLRVEVVGLARRADGGSGFQTFGRKKPVLVQ